MEASHGRRRSGHSRRRFLSAAGGAIAAMLLPPRRSALRARETVSATDLRRYGIVPNAVQAASANAAALKKLVDPAGSFQGRLLFPNTTGSDVYHFDDLIAFHDGIRLDLGGCTLKFRKNGVKRDSASGCIHAVRDFLIENGSIESDYQYNGGYNTGNVLAFGGRGMDTAFFPNLYDRMLPGPMGNITVRNLRIAGSVSGGGGRGILMLGGFDGILIENVSIDGRNQLGEGIYYEFGWASNEPRELDRQSSHARNIRITRLRVENVRNEAVGANGAYDLLIDDLRTRNTEYVCAIGTGEALYYRPWVPPGSAGSRPSFTARNVVGESVRALGFSVTGASRISGSYLDNPPHHDNPYGLGPDQQSDLIDFVLDRFSLTGTPKNYGIVTSAASARISNGTLSGFNRGVVTTQECTHFAIEAVKIFDSANVGILIGQNVSLHSPPRLADGTIRGCVVAGSGTAGKSPALTVATTRSCLIEGCRFGYDLAMDGRTEKTQTQAVSVSADASGVVCRNNIVSSTAEGAVAYQLAGAGRNCHIVNPRGIQSRSGGWS
jgi:hypothetical protein